MKCLNERCPLNKNKKCRSDQVVYEGAFCASRNIVSNKEKEINYGDLITRNYRKQ